LPGPSDYRDGDRRKATLATFLGPSLEARRQAPSAFRMTGDSIRDRGSTGGPVGSFALEERAVAGAIILGSSALYSKIGLVERRPN